MLIQLKFNILINNMLNYIIKLLASKALSDYYQSIIRQKKRDIYKELEDDHISIEIQRIIKNYD